MGHTFNRFSTYQRFMECRLVVFFSIENPHCFFFYLLCNRMQAMTSSRVIPHKQKLPYESLPLVFVIYEQWAHDN